MNLSERAQRYMLVVAMVAMLLGAPASANAQILNSLGSLGSGFGGSTISAVTGCFSGQIKSAVGKLLGKAGSAIGGKVGDTVSKYSSKLLGSKLGGVFGGLVGGGGKVPTADEKTQGFTKDTSQYSSETTKKLKCTNAVTKSLAQVALGKMVDSTVNWVRGGFADGGPIFVEDKSTFFQNIRNDAINEFASTIAQGEYPIGRTVAQDLVRSYVSPFEDTFKYNLDDVISSTHQGMTAKDFAKDFAAGGWDAFASNLEPRNNPFGFYLSAGSELRNRIVNNPKVNEAQSQLDRNGGFLDLQKCAKEVTGVDGTRRCVRYLTQTPGSIVSEQLNLALGSSFRQKENPQDLTNAIAQFIDSKLGGLIQGGLRYIKTSGGSSGGSGSNNITYADTTGIDEIPDTNGGGNENPPAFNLLTDIPSLIDREQRYQAILVEEKPVVQDLINATYELDLCVPGPNPAWQDLANEAVTAMTSSLPGNWRDAIPLDPTLNDLAGQVTDGSYAVGKVKGSSSQSAFGIIVPTKVKNDNNADLSSVIDAVTSAKDKTKDNDKDGEADSDEQKNRNVNWAIVRALTGIPVNNDETLETAQQATRVVQTVYQRYANEIKKIYDINNLPLAAYRARDFFSSLEDMDDSLTENEEGIHTIEASIRRLQTLQTRVENLPAETSPDYASEYKSIENALLVISPSLHSEDTLIEERAGLEELKAQLDEINNPKNGLIKECIDEVSSTSYQGPKDRMPYPQILAKNIHGLNISTSFLPGYTFFSNGPRQIQFLDLANFGVNSITVKVFKFKVFNNFTGGGSGGSFTSEVPANGLATFEKLIGIF